MFIKRPLSELSHIHDLFISNIRTMTCRGGQIPSQSGPKFSFPWCLRAGKAFATLLLVISNLSPQGQKFVTKCGNPFGFSHWNFARIQGFLPYNFVWWTVIFTRIHLDSRNFVQREFLREWILAEFLTLLHISLNKLAPKAHITITQVHAKFS